MSTIDWVIVLGLNLLVFGYGLVRSRETKTNLDWFLGGRSLPFWIVAISLFATSVDSGDIVGVNGMTYVEGISVLTTWWLGVVTGYTIAAFFVLPPMYRAGLFTNAEYLEYRFGPAARVVSALVQFQYRTNILAGIAISLQLTLTLVMGLDETWAWIAVAAFAAMATLYSARGGLKTIAWVDALLTVAMVTGVLVLWSVLWNVAGGWSGAMEKLALKGGADLPGYLLHIGVSRPGSPDPSGGDRGVAHHRSRVPHREPQRDHEAVRRPVALGREDVRSSGLGDDHSPDVFQRDPGDPGPGRLARDPATARSDLSPPRERIPGTGAEGNRGGRSDCGGDYDL